MAEDEQSLHELEEQLFIRLPLNNHNFSLLLSVSRAKNNRNSNNIKNKNRGEKE
jgi:hypothetical protein